MIHIDHSCDDVSECEYELISDLAENICWQEGSNRCKENDKLLM